MTYCAKACDVCVCVIQPAIPSICVVSTGLGIARPPSLPPLFHQRAVMAEQGEKQAARREKNTAPRKLEHRCFFGDGLVRFVRNRANLNGRVRKYWAVKRLAPRETNIRWKHVDVRKGGRHERG